MTMDNKTDNKERTEWCEEDEAGIGCLYILIIFLALACIIGFIAGKALC